MFFVGLGDLQQVCPWLAFCHDSIHCIVPSAVTFKLSLLDFRSKVQLKGCFYQHRTKGLLGDSFLACVISSNKSMLR